jgi:hypothetical protein
MLASLLTRTPPTSRQAGACFAKRAAAPVCKGPTIMAISRFSLRTVAAIALLVLPTASPLLAAEPETPTPLFSRHVVPLLSRLGCNAGACHGAVQGQNGFRLTLFGADPALDHQRLLREAAGRRLNLHDPDASLFLQKATGKVPHMGGRRTTADSTEYRILRAWIAQGVPLDQLPASRLTRLEVEPVQQTAKPGTSYRLRVRATFADGSAEDVTHLAAFESLDRDVASVDETGTVQTHGVGDTALVVRYRAEPVMSMVAVPRPGAEPFPQGAPVNFVDKHILDKLRRLNIHPGEVCDDATFLRRAAIDVTGELPAADDIRAFLADDKADKRARKIDELLQRPGHTRVWATQFCDILKPSRFRQEMYPDGNAAFRNADARRFYEWLRARLEKNMPYDQLVEGILLATSREGRPAEAWEADVRRMVAENTDVHADLKAYAERRTLDLFWQRSGATGVKGALQVAHGFLGLRLECAQCHRHPSDVWQQDDLLSFANFFTRVSEPRNSPNGMVGSSPEVVQMVSQLADEVKTWREQEKALEKQLGDKDTKLTKEEQDQLRKELNALKTKANQASYLANRLRATEIHTELPQTPASMTSPLGTQKSERLRLLGQTQAVTVPAAEDPRSRVMAWMRAPDNPYFARAMVNRIWAHYFGRGIVDPPDHLSPLNPASHPELLAELADGFVKHNFDLRWVHRTILESRTYQQSMKFNATNRADTRNYARFYPRRLSAELLVDAIDQATGSTENWPPNLRMPAGARAIELAGDVELAERNTLWGYALHIFGRPLRDLDVQCDCNRQSSATIVQTLYLANHPNVQDKISSPKGRAAQIARQFADPGQQVDEVYLWTVSRLPTSQERDACLEYLKSAGSPQKGVEGLLRTLLRTREFILNH